MQTTRAHRKFAHTRNRRRQQDGHRDRAGWRFAPADPDQLKALRLIASTTGRTFSTGITRGDAWRRIRSATRLIPERQRLSCAPPWYTPPAGLL